MSKGKPQALLHMMFWGFGSGTILALLYIVFFISLGSMGFIETLTTLFYPDAWRIALMVGGLPGLGLGFLDGLILWAVTRNAPIPFSRTDMKIYRKRVYASIGIVTTLVGFMLTFIFFGLSSFAYVGLLLMFPPFIAGIAAAYAGHRYLFRLRLWSEHEFGMQKEKEKTLSYLAHKPGVDEIYFDDGAESKRHETS